MDPKELHVNNGWYFERCNDGAVKVRIRSPERDQAVMAELTISAEEWAKVVAHVAGTGSTADQSRPLDRQPEDEAAVVSEKKQSKGASKK